MTEKQPIRTPDRRPDCVTEIRIGQLRPRGVRFFQAGQHRNRRRQNGKGAASRSRYTKTGDLTGHKEADLTLLPLYSQPPPVVQ